MTTTAPIALAGPYSPLVLDCGFLTGSDQPRDQVFSPRARPGEILTLRYRFVWVSYGSLHGVAGGRIHEGGLLLIPPGFNGSWRMGPRTRLDHVKFDVVPCQRSIDGNDLVSTDRTLQPSPRAVWGLDLPLVQPAAIVERSRELMMRIRQDYWRSWTQRLRASLLLGSLLMDVVEQALGARPTIRSRTIAKRSGPVSVVEAAQSAMGMAGAIHCADLARIAGLTPSRFRREFPRVEFNTPGRWIRERRMIESSRLLLAGKSLATVADFLGYTSTSAFCRAFRRQFGTTPGRWCRQQGREL